MANDDDKIKYWRIFILRPVVLLMLLALFMSCRSTEMWIPQAASRPKVNVEHVVYLERAPQRPYVVVGILTPPSGNYETFAEMINAMRKEAAKHGADAIYVESHTEEGGWRFGIGFGGAFGQEHTKDVTFRGTAIVWK